MRLIAKSWNDLDRLVISDFEIFGSLIKGDGGGSVSIPLQERDSLEGIIGYLTKECGGNVVDKGIVGVIGNPLCSPHYVVDVSKRSVLGRVVSDQSFCYDFKERRIIPTHYTLRSNEYPDGCDLKSWVIEVSKDGSLWTEVDRHEDNMQLKGMFKTQSFGLKSCGEVRFIRVRQIGPNHLGTDNLALANFEIFGTLLE
jgi:hypothetical protein